MYGGKPPAIPSIYDWASKGGDGVLFPGNNTYYSGGGGGGTFELRPFGGIGGLGGGGLGGGEGGGLGGGGDGRGCLGGDGGGKHLTPQSAQSLEKLQLSV
jgi:hypothetical protein